MAATGLRRGDGRARLHRIAGARVAFEPFTRASVTSLQAWFRAGAALERDGQRGAAHFLEHLLFQEQPARFGGRGLGAVIEDAGGTVNAWTSHDHVVVHATVPSASFDSALAAVTTCVLGACPAPEVVERERGVILQEIARDGENPGLQCMRTLFDERFRGHPYGHRVLGTADSVARLDAEALRAWHRAWYSTSNLVLAVVGDLPEASVMAAIERELSPWTREAPAAPDIAVAASVPGSIRRVVHDSAEAFFGLGFPIPRLGHPDVPALDCLSGLLGETKGSVLETWRRETGLVNEASSLSYTPRSGGVFAVSGSAHPDRLAAAVEGLGALLGERLAAGPGQADLAAVREESLSSSLRQDETAHGRAGRIAYEVAATGRLGFFRRYLAAVQAVTADDVRRVARRYLLGRKPVAVLLGPASAIASVRVPGALPRPRSDATCARPVRLDLPAGPTVLSWRDRSHPLVSVRARFPGGLEQETAATNGSHALLVRLLSCGVGGRPASDWLRDLDSLGARFGGVSGQSWVSIYVEAPAGRLGPALRIAADCLSRPDLSPSDIAREKALLIEEVRTRIDRPSALLQREMIRRLLGDHPYALDPFGTPEALAAVDRNALVAAARRVFDPGRTVVGVVGDADAAAVASTLLGDLKTPDEGTIQCPAGTFDPDGAGRGRFSLRGPFRQEHVGIAWPGVASTSPDRLAASVFANVFSRMSGPLFRHLRDELGIAYATGFSSNALRLGGWISASAAVRRGTGEGAIEGVRKTIERVLQGGPEAIDEVRRSALHLAGVEEMTFQKKGAIAHWMCANLESPLGFDSFLTVARTLREMDPHAIIALARRLLEREPVVGMLVPAD